jgi:hypothetical protein
MSHSPACSFFARVNSSNISIPPSINTTLNMNLAITGGSIAGRYVYSSLDLILNTGGGYTSYFHIYLDRSPSSSQYGRQTYPAGGQSLSADDSSWGDGTDLAAIAKAGASTNSTLLAKNGVLMGVFL